MYPGYVCIELFLARSANVLVRTCHRLARFVKREILLLVCSNAEMLHAVDLCVCSNGGRGLPVFGQLILLRTVVGVCTALNSSNVA